MKLETPALMHPVLQDTYGRVIRKLRVSLTDACNYRCFYCMPKDATFTKQSELLSPLEIENICKGLVEHGITQLRVTGGEPTLRKDFPDIMQSLGGLAGVQLALTSNGENLEQYLGLLWRVGCRSLNISMDSLDAGKFERITYGGDLEKVLRCIFRAQAMGFKIKINCVVFRDINSDELTHFHDWSAIHGIEVRFLEFMKIGPGYRENFNRFISADEMMDILQKGSALQKVVDAFDSTSVGYRSDAGARLGFIASESKPFCDTCSRLRLSAMGDLRSCLMSEKGVNIRSRDALEYPQILQQVMAMKPIERLDHVDQAMYQIGG